MAMHSRSIDAQPEIISYVADSHVHCEHASTDLGVGSREFSTKYRKSEARLRRTWVGNADQRESRRAHMKALHSHKAVFGLRTGRHNTQANPTTAPDWATTELSCNKAAKL